MLAGGTRQGRKFNLLLLFLLPFLSFIFPLSVPPPLLCRLSLFIIHVCVDSLLHLLQFQELRTVAALADLLYFLYVLNPASAQITIKTNKLTNPWAPLCHLLVGVSVLTPKTAGF